MAAGQHPLHGIARLHVDGSGERAVGQFPDGSPEEALAYFERKYTELAGQVTLLEALAAIDQMEQQDRDNPQTRALCAALRKLALLVYDYPEWTRYDAYVYAQQECLRAPPP